MSGHFSTIMKAIVAASRWPRGLVPLLGALVLCQGGCAAKRAPPPAVIPAQGAADTHRLEALRLEQAGDRAADDERWGEAAAHYERGASAARGADDPQLLSELLNSLAVAWAAMGLHQKALDACQDAIDVRLSTEGELATLYYNKGMILWAIGERERAARVLREAAEAASGVEAAMMWLQLSELHQELEDGRQMRADVTAARASLAEAEEDGVDAAYARALAQEGFALELESQVWPALDALLGAADAYEALSMALEAGQVAYNAGLLAERLGALDTAEAAYRRALKCALSIGDDVSIGLIDLRLERVRRRVEPDDNRL